MVAPFTISFPLQIIIPLFFLRKYILCLDRDICLSRFSLLDHTRLSLQKKLLGDRLGRSRTLGPGSARSESELTTPKMDLAGPAVAAGRDGRAPGTAGGPPRDLRRRAIVADSPTVENNNNCCFSDCNHCFRELRRGRRRRLGLIFIQCVANLPFRWPPDLRGFLLMNQ